jgi:hypothetical protein
MCLAVFQRQMHPRPLLSAGMEEEGAAAAAGGALSAYGATSATFASGGPASFSAAARLDIASATGGLSLYSNDVAAYVSAGAGYLGSGGVLSAYGDGGWQGATPGALALSAGDSLSLASANAMTLNAGNGPLSAYTLHSGFIQVQDALSIYGEKSIYAHSTSGPIVSATDAGQISSYGGFSVTLAAPHLGELAASAVSLTGANSLFLTSPSGTLSMASGTSITRGAGTSALTVTGTSTLANSVITSGAQIGPSARRVSTCWATRSSSSRLGPVPRKASRRFTQQVSSMPQLARRGSTIRVW